MTVIVLLVPIAGVSYFADADKTTSSPLSNPFKVPGITDAVALPSKNLLVVRIGSSIVNTLAVI